MKKQTIESRVASTIMELPEPVKIGRLKISIKQPSFGTLILASKALSEIPPMRLGDDEVISSVLADAKDQGGIADVLAILILGSKRIKRYGWLGIQRIVANAILNNWSPEQVQIVLHEQLTHQQVGDFFAITTSLAGINLLVPTKVVVKN